jgi:hypothetical protein
MPMPTSCIGWGWSIVSECQVLTNGGVYTLQEVIGSVEVHCMIGQAPEVPDCALHEWFV